MPRRTKPLTVTEINTARCHDGKGFSLYDGDGLEIFISPVTKIWRFRYYRPDTHKRAMVSFGAFPAVSLADARSRRHEAHSLLSKGIDPQKYRQEQKAEEARINQHTFYNVATDWYAMKTSQNLAANTVKDIWRSLEKYVLPYIGHIPISTLTAHQFVTLLEPVRARGKLETLKRVLQRINEVMDFAANSGLININTAANVRKAFPSPVKKHMLSIPPDQLPALMQALSIASIDRQTRLLIEWQLLTATRPVEAASARWCEIDQQAHTWTIPAGRMKMRRTHIIPLSSQAMAVLEAMKPVSAQREYIFPGIRDPKKPMHSQSANAALRRMGYHKILVSHGLRAIFSTAANKQQHFHTDVIEAALAHVNTNQVRRAYDRNDYLEARVELMQWWGNLVESAATGVTIASGCIQQYEKDCCNI